MGTPGMDLPEALRLFAQAGLDGAEVIWGEDFPASMQEGAGGREAAELGKLAGDLGLEVACLTPYMTGLNSLDAAERRRDLDRFGRCIEDAGVLGCPNIRVYAGSFMPGEEGVREEKWELLIGSLRVLAKDAEEAGVTLCVENHFNTMTVTAAETAELVKAVGSEAVGALYDQANLTFTHAEPHEEAIRVQSPFIRHVHVKDLVFVDPDKAFAASSVENVSQEDRAVRSRVVGDGVLDWTDILRRLREVGYDGYLSLEYEYRWHPDDLPDPAEGFARSARALRDILYAIGVAER